MSARPRVFRAAKIARGPVKPGNGVVRIRRTYADNWDELRDLIVERDHWQCRRCGCSVRDRAGNGCHVHHILELSRGGSNRPSNLITLCRKCHHDQHDHNF